MSYSESNSPRDRQPHPPKVTSWSFFGGSHADPHHPPHRHDSDQLLWFPSGGLEVDAEGERWLVQNDSLVWFPAGAVHSIRLLAPGSTVSIYLSATLRPAGERWARPRVISASPLLMELVRHVGSSQLTAPHRETCYRLLIELLAESEDRRVGFSVPAHWAARRIAEHLLSEPDDATSLDAWSQKLGVSSRTIMRAFVTETGQSFARWRTRARLIAASAHLADGLSVQATAVEVGYRTASGFITAFREAFGVTPATYAREQHRHGRDTTLLANSLD
ncbi:helix-turn-helix domain-containing protein [Aeromicrobium sp. YIM 150415]|uniref:helix-turn-helix domain-containing protein n=1 Tax=Aeromicrobium sp. YIM 150415 TaxID=2803912 RepID=UPI001965EE50|nr:AraC family transcriptional regulator [Aeromicrobium sp. YIM 150415]MBM9465156.1 helix-turn-helix domain-containing protein [Aeromicrobium sp. YIM 150415]